MQTEDTWQAPAVPAPPATGDGERPGLSEELEAARRAQADAERRAAHACEELREMQAGLGWRALASYRGVARRLAPAGSRRGDAYDLAIDTARRSSRRLGRRVTGRPATDAPAPAEDAAAPPDVGPAAEEQVAGPPGADTWFADHYGFAADRVIEFLALDGISLQGKDVADIGAGDGILDLGIVHKGNPARLVAFDVNAIHGDILLEAARRQGVCDALPPALQFEVSRPTGVPAEDGSFDVVVTWSAFEHIEDPLGVLREARRVVRDDGALFLQVWPFYHSQFGSHLRDWFPDGWEHLEKSAVDIEAEVRASDLHTSQWADVMLSEFRELNKVTVDDLGRALVEAGFEVRRLNLLSRNVPLPPGPASRVALSALGIEGVELTAVPVARTSTH
jgi:2-polyprenyl-3-methyl-5-hydroxy-6-metoxy-1,4-benzoquinol methylase